MSLVECIEADLKEAMKAQNEPVRSALRLVRAAMQNKCIDLGHPLSEEEAKHVIRTLVKQYTDALVDFEKADRADLVSQHKAEIELLSSYLPAQMLEKDIETIVKKVVAEMNATPQDFGRVMGAVMKETAGKADGVLVKTTVEKMLRRNP